MSFCCFSSFFFVSSFALVSVSITSKLDHPNFSLWVHSHPHTLYVPLSHALLAHLHGVCPPLTRFLFSLLIIIVVFSFFLSFPFFLPLFFLLCLPSVSPLALSVCQSLSLSLRDTILWSLFLAHPIRAIIHYPVYHISFAANFPFPVSHFPSIKT